MQRYTVYFIWKLLYLFRVVPPPIIRSAKNCIYSIWYSSHRYCYLPLSWKSSIWFECAVGGVGLSVSSVTTPFDLVCHFPTVQMRIVVRGGSVEWGITLTSRKVADSISDGVIDIFHLPYSSNCTKVLRLTQPVRYPFNRRLYGFLCWFKGCGQ